MFDPHRCYKWLDSQDPRLTSCDAPPSRPDARHLAPLEVVCNRVKNVQMFLCLLDDSGYNPLRERARAILHVLEALKLELKGVANNG